MKYLSDITPNIESSGIHIYVQDLVNEKSSVILKNSISSIDIYFYERGRRKKVMQVVIAVVKPKRNFTLSCVSIYSWFV